MAKRQIYLDHAATTPLDPRVFDAMLPYLKEHYGNASSVHAMGRKARYAIEESRERISAILGVVPGDIIFTSGGTESSNAAIKGVLKNRAGGVLTSIVEHEAVLTQAKGLEHAGKTVKFLPPDRFGRTSLDQIQAQQLDDIAVMSFMHANNEVGALNDIDALGAFCASKDIIFHTDAVQTAGWYNWPASIGNVDLISISAHKFYGPKGAGCLVATRNAELKGIIEGGSQERRRRGGTENVAGIVGMAEAMTLAFQEQDERVLHLRKLQAHLLDALDGVLDKDRYILNTSSEPAENAPHIVNIAFPPIDGDAVDGEMLILNLDVEGVLVSSGSACTSGAIEPSHVLLGLDLDQDTASAAVRFSMGKDNTIEEIDYAVDKLGLIIKRMREKSNV